MHDERHYFERIGWLRAAVLGANDGIISTASLMVGVAGASVAKPEILLAGVAGLTAGALSMAAGEFVSVSSQADSEAADLARESKELETQPEAELRELTQIYEDRGLSADLAQEVAKQLTEHDALGAHARDELSISHATRARPLQAALSSAFSFAAGALLPLLTGLAAPGELMVPALFTSALLALAVLGAISARTGGASMPKSTVRVVFWGALAIAVTFFVGSIFGAVA